MKHLLKSMVGTVTGFIRSIFFDREERIFISSQSPEQLLESLQRARVGWRSNVAGLCGSLRGSQVRLGWSSGGTRKACYQMFHGCVEPAPEGSRLRGYFAPPLFLRCFMAVWLGFLALFTLLSVWTLIFPVAGFVMVWVAAQLWGTSTRHSEEGLTTELRRLCGAPLTDAEVITTFRSPGAGFT